MRIPLKQTAELIPRNRAMSHDLIPLLDIVYIYFTSLISFQLTQA